MDPLRFHILEAVECLRQRKCRPDRESIAHYVLRKFGSTMNEIFAELENIVDESGLIKVEYKGTTSYRNPENFDTKNSPLLTKHSKILNSSKTTRLIVSAINELLVKDPNYTQCGVPLDELREKLAEFDSSRFTNESMHVVLEREISCGGIHMGKANYLPDPFRVFPKDLPISADMQAIISLNVDNSIEVKEEKKIKKTRKSISDSLDVNKPRKYAVKHDLETHIGDDDQSEDGDDMDDDGMKPSSRKGAKLTSLGRKIVAEQVAEAVRKSYESTTEFETTSAQMFKLAQTVVSKQVEQPPIVEKEAIVPKGPSLVLASSIDHSSSNEQNNRESDDTTTDKDHSSSPNGEAVEVKEKETKFQESEIIGTGGRKRGRPSIKNDKNGISPNNTPSSPAKEKPVNQTTPTKTKPPDEEKNKSPLQGEQGLIPLTRSKRDKRKKQVFDPSDLPTYSRSIVTKKPRLSETLPTKNKPPASIKRGRQSVPASTVVELSVTPKTNVTGRKGNLKRKRNSSNATSSTNNSPSSSKNKDASISDGSSENEVVEDNKKNNKNKEISFTKKASPVVETKPVALACSYCQTTKQCHENVAAEDFLSCSSCSSSFHWSCLKYSSGLANRIKEFAISRKLDWQCIQCKKCATCQQKITERPPSNANADAQNEGDEIVSAKDKASSSCSLQIVLCETCDAGFHATCTKESFEKKETESSWNCPQCRRQKKETSPRTDASTATEAKSGVSGRTQRKLKTATTVKVPEDETNSGSPVFTEPGHVFSDDLRLWSKEDVELYFVQKGLKEEAADLLRKQVDGYSLLLLQREDVLSGMHFRLSRALKVYRLILELQAKAPIQPHSSWVETEGKKQN